MSDGIIDLTQYLPRDPGEPDPQRGAFALWGAEGERSRFALPLWRTIYLAQGERGVIAWRVLEDTGPPTPFVILDLGSDPARLEMRGDTLPFAEDGEPPTLHDRGADGLSVFLGVRDDRMWHLIVDGGGQRTGLLRPKTREDILFLAGECAGLLFLRDFADEVQ